MGALSDAVNVATEAFLGGDGLRAKALAELARTLAKEIESPALSDKPPPTAGLSKELRATLEELEGLRDGDDAQAALIAELSTAILDPAGSVTPLTRPARRKDRGEHGEAADAVAAARRGRGARGAS